MEIYGNLWACYLTEETNNERKINKSLNLKKTYGEDENPNYKSAGTFFL